MEPDTEAPTADAPPSPVGRGVHLKYILITAAAVGVLAGLAEVCWTYRLPGMVGGWRAVLPGSPAGLGLFVLAATATDACVCLIGALLCYLPVKLVLLRKAEPPLTPRGRWVIRSLILAAAMSYLYVGWMGLFVLLPEERAHLAYLGVMGLGVVGAIALSLILNGLLSLAQRRLHRRSVAAGWVMALVAVVAATLPPFAWHSRSPDIGNDPPVLPGGPRPNILLVTLDTLRFDYVACYGNRWVKTPALDGLAREGVLFEYAISQAPTTGPSHSSIMTSVYPPQHGGTNSIPLKRGLLTIADVLAANGYETIAFTSSTSTRSINTGLHQGFDRYEDSLVPWSMTFSRDEFQSLIFFYLAGIARNSMIRGEVVTRRALSWLETRSDRPFFAWLHYFDPHDPYDPPPHYRDMYRGKLDDGLPMRNARELYAGEVSYTDAQLGTVLKALKQRGLYDNTLIIVVSDHGEAFGERHGARIQEFAHGQHLYDTTQRVPLIIKTTDPRDRGRRVNQQVELIDIFPTILEALAVPIPESLRGRPLNELLAGKVPPRLERPALSFNVLGLRDPDSPHGRAKFVDQFARRTWRWKYVEVDRREPYELYDLRHDPQERVNLARKYPQECQEARDHLVQFLGEGRGNRVDSRGRLAPSLIRQLEALGYLRDDAIDTAPVESPRP